MPLVQTTVYLTSGSGSWVVPANCVSIDAIHAVGGGAGGARYQGMNPSLGGGGGAYARDVPASTVPGATYCYSVGSAGAGSSTQGYFGTPGGDTWLRWDGNNSPPTAQGQGVLADGGYAGEAYLWYYRAYGGKAANSIGAVKYDGGEGGQPGTSDGAKAGGGGGGAAGGPDGPGGKGGSGGAYFIYQDGGGGGGLYGDGGLPDGGAAKGGSRASLNEAGESGVNGGGGGGGGEGDGTASGRGRSGANGGAYLIGASYGPGGGGGGGGVGANANGGSGGSGVSNAWGSGGGGGGGCSGTGNVNGIGGNGRPGGIAITYTYSTDPLPPTSFPGAIIPFL